MHIWGMDIFRGIAALLVFFFHFWTFYSAPENIFFAAGHLGVDLFFVLSGFLVTLSLFHHSEKPSGIKHYFSARIRRIVPLALLSVTIFFLIKGNFSAHDFFDFFAHIFFIQGFFFDFYHGINPVMWTLSVEILFYILLPFLYIVVAKKSIPSFFHAAFLLVLLSFFWRGVVFYFFENSTPEEKFILSEQLLGRFDQFFLGIFLAIFVYKSWNISEKFTYMLMVSGIGILLFSFYTFATQGSDFRLIFWMQMFLHSLVGVGFFLFLLGFIPLFGKTKKQSNIKKEFEWKKLTTPFLFLGTISYGLYLFHFPILSQVSEYIKNPALGFFVSLFLTILISFLSWEFFEKKFLRKKSA